jgi:predicted phosphodiesterase
MLPDFEIVSHEFKTRKPITIFPVADLHLGAAEQMEEAFTAFIDMVRKTPNAYLIIDGDMLDNGVKNSVTNVYRQRYMPSEAKRLLAKMLEPVRDRILVGTGGNHEFRSAREVDDSPLYDVFAKLDIENRYRENMAFLRLGIGNKDAAGMRNPTYCIVVTHGSGGGVLTGGAVNKAERFGYVLDGGDILVVGHTHKQFDTTPGKIKIDLQNNKVSVKPFKVVSVSSWLSYGGYAARMMLPPNTHVETKIVLGATSKWIEVSNK